jgi:hypothetical protein
LKNRHINKCSLRMTLLNVRFFQHCEAIYAWRITTRTRLWNRVFFSRSRSLFCRHSQRICSMWRRLLSLQCYACTSKYGEEKIVERIKARERKRERSNCWRTPKKARNRIWICLKRIRRQLFDWLTGNPFDDEQSKCKFPLVSCCYLLNHKYEYNRNS